ncbi:MAG: hypothetical protein NVS9B11_14320 [Candidatus Dormibacteraceae bacterium]
MVETVAAGIAWLGASVLVLADGRRGLALGLALVAAGFSVIALTSGLPAGAAAVATGGGIAAWQCWRSPSARWKIMPPGSTPRLVLCIGSGLFGLWVAAALMIGPGAGMRFAVLVVLGLMGARVLASSELHAVLAGIAGLALALGASAGLDVTSAGIVPDVAAGLIAAGVMALPRRGHVHPGPAPNSGVSESDKRAI